MAEDILTDEQRVMVDRFLEMIIKHAPAGSRIRDAAGGYGEVVIKVENGVVRFISFTIHERAEDYKVAIKRNIGS